MFEGPVPAEKPAMDESFDDELSALFEDKKPATAAKPVVDQSFEDELSAMFEEKKPRQPQSRQWMIPLRMI